MVAMTGSACTLDARHPSLVSLSVAWLLDAAGRGQLSTSVHHKQQFPSLSFIDVASSFLPS